MHHYRTRVHLAENELLQKFLLIEQQFSPFPENNELSFNFAMIGFETFAFIINLININVHIVSVFEIVCKTK